MRRFALYFVLALYAASLLGSNTTNAARWTAEMKEGKAELKSTGPLAFGPDGILFASDTRAAAIVAIATGDTKPAGVNAVKVEGINQKVAALLGTAADQILIDDMAVNPVSHNVYLSVSRGRGPGAAAAIVRVKTDGQPELVSLDKVKFSRVELAAAPADKMVGEGNRQSNPRQESITDVGFLNGQVIVAGLSNEEFASTLRSVPFPFKAAANPTSVEIYHGSHGRFETRAPIRTFTTFKIGKEDQVLAAYTCTPLVQFPINELQPGAKVKGKTIAELGNRNRPLDMITYQKDGKTYLLMANSSRGVMKITTEQIDKAESITAPVPDKKGLAYETIAAWTGVEQLDRLDAKNVLLLVKGEGGAMKLESMPLP